MFAWSGTNGCAIRHDAGEDSRGQRRRHRELNGPDRFSSSPRAGFLRTCPLDEPDGDPADPEDGHEKDGSPAADRSVGVRASCLHGFGSVILRVRSQGERLLALATLAAATAATGCAARSPRSVKSATEAPAEETPAHPPSHTMLHWPHDGEWRDATLQALRAERTWIPAAAALAVAPWDRKISDWATSHTPVFGSVDNAQEASGRLLGYTHVSMLVTAVVEPGGEAPWRSRFNRILVEYGAIAASNGTTSLTKALITRTRPDGDGEDSFPSGHSTSAFASATLASFNLEGTPMPGGLRIGLDAGITTLAAGTAWARVEGGRHFPSDVLAGAAIGSFVSTWIHQCFLRDNPYESVDLRIGRHEWSASARVVF